MHAKLMALLAAVDGRAGAGISLHALEIRRAVDVAAACPALVALLDAGYEIARCERVLFTNRVGWIDVLFALTKDQAAKRLVLTYRAPAGDLIALAELHDGFPGPDRATADLPFALAAASRATDARAADDDPNLVELTRRRALFGGALAAAGLPLLVTGEAARAQPTMHEIRTQTSETTTDTTSRSTSELTTPNDNDTQTDYVMDHHADYHDDLHMELR
jgi:hypothetical protein